RVSPGAISKDTPLTAYTWPRCVEKRTCSPSTERSGSATAPQLRVECLAHAVADQVEAEHGDDDRDAGDDREKRRALEVPVDLRQHRPPLRRTRILWAETEETEAGDVDDRGRQRERPLNDHRRHRVREDVREEDLAARHADRARGEDEVVLALGEDRPAEQA